MKKPILSFTVQMSKWRCGGDAENPENRLGGADSTTSLLNHAGRMCCLGFACRAAGFKGPLRGRGDPSALNVELPGLNQWHGSEINGDFYNSKFSTAAIAINDNVKTTVAEKKEKLLALGKKHNIKIKFVP